MTTVHKETLPAEKKLLYSVPHFSQLTPEEAEALALIAEECSEVIQAITKIQRHALWSEHPESHIPNWRTLQREVGDVMAAFRVGEGQRLIEWANVVQARDEKLRTLPKYLHHAKVVRELPDYRDDSQVDT